MNELQLYEAINLIDDDLILEAEQEEWASSDAYFVRSTPRWHIAVGSAAAAVAVAVGVIGLSNLKISGGLPVDSSVGEISSQGALSSSPLVDNSDSSPEPQIPAGEPTFLTCPDGTPIYTSEISEVYTVSEESGKEKPSTLAEAEQIAQTGDGFFIVKCDGFVYGYIRQRAVNRIENPELFEDSGDGENYKYLGEVSEEKNGAVMRQVNLIRIKPGDKFGELTVKNAYTLFTGNPPYIPRAHIARGCIEFDGAIELEGYICVTPMNTSYGAPGDMIFYPNSDSSIKLPCVIPQWNKEDQKYYAVAMPDPKGYFGNIRFDIGNMYKVEYDTSGLHRGDSMVKAKIVLENIRYVPGISEGWKYDLKSIELL